jgi:ComF family protein
MLKYLLNLLFPPKCIFCGDIVRNHSRIDVCSLCYEKLPFICEGKIKPEKGQYFDEVICVFEYSTIIKKAILKYKFFNKPHYYRTFALLLSDKINMMTIKPEIDIIISVPLHKSRQRSRGYNQSYLISRAVSKEIGVKEGSYLLLRVKETQSQSTLPKNKRHSNIENAFKVLKHHEIKGKKILIIDDILTTGSTLNECSRVLKEAGALQVIAAVIASGRKNYS